MILAAGKGTRVRPLTYDMPKPMIPILGKPVMEYLLETLAQHGIRQIMVNVSYLPQQIEDYFGDGRRWNVELGYSFEGELQGGEIQAMALGSAGGMKRIQEFSGFFDSTFLVVCGDALIDVDLRRAIQIHRQSGAIASLIAKEVPLDQVSSYGVVVADETGRITSFQEKPRPEEARSNLVNTGVYIFEPEVLDLIPAGREYDIGSQLFPALVERGLLFRAIQLPFAWIDIGRVSDFWEVHMQLLQGAVPGLTIPGTQVRPGVWAGLNVRADWKSLDIKGPVYVGGGSHLETGCVIRGPVWIGHGCHIQNGAQIRSSVLFPYTRVGARATVDEMIVSGRYCSDKSGSFVEMAGTGLDWLLEDARTRGSIQPPPDFHS